MCFYVKVWFYWALKRLSLFTEFHPDVSHLETKRGKSLNVSMHLGILHNKVLCKNSCRNTRYGGSNWLMLVQEVSPDLVCLLALGLTFYGYVCRLGCSAIWQTIPELWITAESYPNLNTKPANSAAWRIHATWICTLWSACTGAVKVGFDRLKSNVFTQSCVI